MRKSRFRGTADRRDLKELKAGKKAAAIGRERGISEATLYNWRAKNGSLHLSSAAPLG